MLRLQRELNTSKVQVPLLLRQRHIVALRLLYKSSFAHGTI